MRKLGKIGTFFIALSLGAATLAGVGRSVFHEAVAEDDEYAMTIDSSNNGNNNVHWTGSSVTSLSYDGITWNTSVTGTTSFTASKTYCQIGSKSNPATNISLTTKGFEGKKITEVAVTCFCMTNDGPKLTVTVGSTTFINSEALTKTTSTEMKSSGKSATCGANESISVVFNSSAKAAICISKISVKYEVAEISKIEVNTPPTKTTYQVGDKFDPSGLIIKATYSNSSTKNIAYADDPTQFTFSPSLTTALTTDNTSVQIMYNNKSCNQPISVTATKIIDHITINTNPKTDYIEGDKFDPDGLKINVFYENQEESELVTYNTSTADKFSFSPSMNTELEEGKVTETITYISKSIDIVLNVSKRTEFKYVYGTTMGEAKAQGNDSMTLGVTNINSTSACFGNTTYDNYRFYKQGDHKFGVVENSGAHIVSVCFKNDVTPSGSKFFLPDGEPGEYNTTDSTWTGFADSVTLKCSDTVKADNITIIVSYKTLITLETPTLSYENGKLSWNFVDNASKYSLKIDSDTPILLENTINEYDVASLDEKEHCATIMAVGDLVDYENSAESSPVEWDTTPYVTKLTTISGSIVGIIGQDNWNLSKLSVNGLLSNGQTIDVTNDCSFELEKTSIPSQEESGTMSVTANFVGESKVSVDSISQEIPYTVITKHSGETIADAFTVEEAIEHIDAKDLNTSKTYYVQGKFVNETWRSGSEQKMSINISSSGESGSSNKVLNLYNLNIKRDFAAKEMVYAYGSGSNFKLYNNLTYELIDGSYLQDSLQSLSVSGQTVSFKAGETFVGATEVMANYLLSNPKDVTDKVSYTLNNTPISIGAAVPVSAVGDSTKVIVSYTDSAKTTKTFEYNVTVKYADPVANNISIDGGDAMLVYNGSRQFSATLSGEYIDTHASIVWSVTSNTVNDDYDFENGFLVVGETEGTIVIRATVQNYPNAYNEITVTVNGTPTLTLDKNEITGIWSGAADGTLKATIDNFKGTPSITWTSNNTDAVEVIGNGENATLKYKAGGNATITAVATYTTEGGTVQEASDTCIVNVSQSAVTLLTLNTNVETIYTASGAFDLIATITTQGTATDTIEWSVIDDKDDGGVVSITEEGKTCKVVGLNKGSATVTATSTYDNEKTASCVFTVIEDKISISWQHRGDLNFFKGDKFAFASDATASATYVNKAKSDVNLLTFPEGLTGRLTYGTGKSAIEKDIDLTTYQFSLEDNGAKLSLVYNDGTLIGESTSSEISVINWRHVNLLTDVFGIYSITSDGEYNYNSDGGLTNVDISYGGYKAIFDGDTTYAKCVRFGSNTQNGSVKFASSSYSITSIEIVARYNTAGVSMIVNGITYSLTSSFEKYSIDFKDSVKEVEVETTGTKKKFDVAQITLYSYAENDIGKTDSCLHLESFIDNTLNNETLTYAQKRYAYNELPANERDLFINNSAYSDEKATLSSLATENHEHFDTNNLLVKDLITVTMDLGNGQAETCNIAYGEKFILNDHKPEREGYTFYGWSYNGEILKNDLTITEPVTLVAVWHVSDISRVSVTGEANIVYTIDNNGEFNSVKSTSLRMYLTMDAGTYNELKDAGYEFSIDVTYMGTTINFDISKTRINADGTVTFDFALDVTNWEDDCYNVQLVATNGETTVKSQAIELQWVEIAREMVDNKEDYKLTDNQVAALLSVLSRF